MKAALGVVFVGHALSRLSLSGPQAYQTHDWASVQQRRSLLTGAYAKARRAHLVLDNLNTHFKKCFDDVLGERAATKLLSRVQFHYTPKHASWLNMAEI